MTVDPKTTQNPVYAPLPSYPEEARIHHWGGFALYEVHCQFNGTAPYVFTRISTGHQVLDEAGKAALRQWRWHPGRLRLLAIFMTFEPGKQSTPSSGDRAREKVKGPTATTKTERLRPLSRLSIQGASKTCDRQGIFELRFDADGTI